PHRPDGPDRGRNRNPRTGFSGSVGTAGREEAERGQAFDRGFFGTGRPADPSTVGRSEGGLSASALSTSCPAAPASCCRGTPVGRRRGLLTIRKRDWHGRQSGGRLRPLEKLPGGVRHGPLPVPAVPLRARIARPQGRLENQLPEVPATAAGAAAAAHHDDPGAARSASGTAPP